MNTNSNMNIESNDMISKSISDVGNTISKTSDDLVKNTSNVISDVGNTISKTSDDLMEEMSNFLTPEPESIYKTNNTTSIFNNDINTSDDNNVLKMVVNYLRENGLYILLIIFIFLFLMSIFSILGISTEKKDTKDNKKYKKIVTVEGFKSDIDYKY